MHRFIEISKTKGKRSTVSRKLDKVNLKLLHNIECEKAGAELPYDWGELHAEAEAIRAEMAQVVETLSDEAAVIVPDLFPAWDCNRGYKAGERFTYNGNLYRCKSDNPVNPTWAPDVTHNYYEPVAKPNEDGTLTSPITAVTGMEYEVGKYYSEGGKVYLCKREGATEGDKITLHFLPSALVGQYFEEVAA